MAELPAIERPHPAGRRGPGPTHCSGPQVLRVTREKLSASEENLAHKHHLHWDVTSGGAGVVQD